MPNLTKKLAAGASNPRGAILVVLIWLLAVVVLSAVAPGAKSTAISSGEGSIHGDTPSAKAQQLLDVQYPGSDELQALLVFHDEAGLSTEDMDRIAAVSAWLASQDKPDAVQSAAPFHEWPSSLRERQLSDDRTTLLLPAALQGGLDSDRIHDAIESIRSAAERLGLGGMQLEITGPAGIAADTISIFRHADLVLLLATVGLILVILMLIYRSPLLAILPLVSSGIVYAVVDRLLGLGADNGWWVVDKQALSIMMILLFAVLTDYCLFVLSRYREELRKIGSKYDAMRVAMTSVSEPILFSGGTVLAAMVTLFATVFEPYHYFAPVFSVAVIVILLAGLTLVPALFAIAGRRGFWPFIPRLTDLPAPSSRFWTRVGRVATNKPAITAGIIGLLLLAFSVNAVGMKYSFNIMGSFPKDMSSRLGFELLAKHYPPGQLAPVTVLLAADPGAGGNTGASGRQGVDPAAIARLAETLGRQAGVESAKPDPVMSSSGQAGTLTLILQDNPYTQSALNVVERLRGQSEQMLRDSGIDSLRYQLHYDGQTAQQLDVRGMNERDTRLLFALVTLLIALMLFLQARSIRVAAVMMGTMLLSYAAAMGLCWAIFRYGFGYEAVSYRLPVYTFVFLMALGVDYNIMLVSRIREEHRQHGWLEAIRRGLTATGGVISSAGIVLAATFAVLITQPLQELFLFGILMAVGILLDTWVVRGMLLPSLLALFTFKSRS